jgi:hypothetical protein
MFKRKRHNPEKTKETPSNNAVAMNVRCDQGFLLTWESEMRAIAADASAWSVETGGDLFGRSQDTASLMLATKAGPRAQRDNAHFRLDVDYLRRLSEVLASDWALRYLGDWHSHHRLGLSGPSGGDRRRIRSVAARNQFSTMIEIIVTLEDGEDAPVIRLHPWIYELGKDKEPSPLSVKVLTGISPVREALLKRRILPEQQFLAWEKASLHRIRIGPDATPPHLEPAQDADSATKERTLTHLAEALQAAGGGPVERHGTGFGCVLVAKVAEPYYIAFAVGQAWPMAILEVDRMDRKSGSAEPMHTPEGLAATDAEALVEIFRSAKASRKGVSDVDD